MPVWTEKSVYFDLEWGCRIVFALISRVTRWERGILACFLWHKKYSPYSLQIAPELLVLFVPPTHPGEGGRQEAKTVLGRPYFVYLPSRVTRCNSNLPSLPLLCTELR